MTCNEFKPTTDFENKINELCKDNFIENKNYMRF